MRGLLSFAIKAVVSVGLLYFAFRLVDLAAMQERASRLDFTLVAALIATLFVQVAVGGVRWRIVARRCGALISNPQAMYYMLIGTFFSQTLPSTVGADAARIWLLGRKAGWKPAIYSVLVDRGAGLFWLAVLVLVSLPWSTALITNPIGRVALVLVGLACLAGPLVLFILARFGGRWLERWRMTRHIGEVAALAWEILTTPKSGIVVGLLSIAVHMLTVLAAWLSAKAIGSPLTLFDAALVIPPVILIAAVPISIAGWGVREGAMIAAFTYANLPGDDGLAVSLLLGGGQFAVGMIGGLLWIASSEHKAAGGAPAIPPAEQL